MFPPLTRASGQTIVYPTSFVNYGAVSQIPNTGKILPIGTSTDNSFDRGTKIQSGVTPLATYTKPDQLTNPLCHSAEKDVLFWLAKASNPVPVPQCLLGDLLPTTVLETAVEMYPGTQPKVAVTSFVPEVTYDVLAAGTTTRQPITGYVSSLGLRTLSVDSATSILPPEQTKQSVTFTGTQRIIWPQPSPGNRLGFQFTFRLSAYTSGFAVPFQVSSADGSSFAFLIFPSGPVQLRTYNVGGVTAVGTSTGWTCLLNTDYTFSYYPANATVASGQAAARLNSSAGLTSIVNISYNNPLTHNTVYLGQLFDYPSSTFSNGFQGRISNVVRWAATPGPASLPDQCFNGSSNQLPLPAGVSAMLNFYENTGNVFAAQSVSSEFATSNVSLTRAAVLSCLEPL
jgi:hypothetical protein